MLTDELNRLIERTASPRLAKCGQNKISCTLLAEGDYLFMSPRTNTLSLFMRCETLGESAVTHRELFEELLKSNMYGGRFNNIRLSYDPDTTIVWLCYDVGITELNATSFGPAVNEFIKNADKFRDLINNRIIEVVSDGQFSDEAKKGPTAYAPDRSAPTDALILQSLDTAPARHAHDEAAAEYTARKEASGGFQDLNQAENLAEPVAKQRTEEEELLSIMASQNMFIMA